MKVVGLMVVLVSVAAVSSCSRIVTEDATSTGTSDVSRSVPMPTDTTSTNEEPGSVPSHSNHRASVITDAGRIDAVVVDGELELEVASQAGWESAVERSDGRARVMWSQGRRTVVVELRGSTSGISQEVVASG